MAKVARSSTRQKNINKLVFHRPKISFQTHAGAWNLSNTCQIADQSTYTLRLDGQFSQSGKLEKKGQITLYVPGGCKPELQVLDSQFKLNLSLDLASYHTILGAQQRLQLLGYLNRTPSEIEDNAFQNAVLNFQVDHDFEPTGMLDEAIMLAIKDAQGA